MDGGVERHTVNPRRQTSSLGRHKKAGVARFDLDVHISHEKSQNSRSHLARKNQSASRTRNPGRLLKKNPAPQPLRTLLFSLYHQSASALYPGRDFLRLLLYRSSGSCLPPPASAAVQSAGLAANPDVVGRTTGTSSGRFEYRSSSSSFLDVDSVVSIFGGGVVDPRSA